MSTGINTIREMHDELLEVIPEGASHAPDDCPVCCGLVVEEAKEEGSVKTFTEEEVQAQVAAAVTEAVTEATKDLEARVQENEKTTELSQLQSQLDSTVLEAQKAKDEKQEIVDWRDAEKQKAEEEAETASRREGRLEKVKEVASFPEEYLTENADRWASLSDEQFEAALEDWRKIGVKQEKKPEEETKIPTKTAMTASRETSSEDNPLREVLRLKMHGVDPRTIR